MLTITNCKSIQAHTLAENRLSNFIMASTNTSTLPTPHLRGRIIIDGPKKPTPIQNFSRAKRYVLSRYQKAAKEKKVRRQMARCGIRYADDETSKDTSIQPTDCVAEYTEATRRAMRDYRIEIRYHGQETHFHKRKMGPESLWADQPGVTADWEMGDAPRWDRADDPLYDLWLAPEATVEEAAIARSKSMPAIKSEEARAAQEADRANRRHSIADFARKILHIGRRRTSYE